MITGIQKQTLKNNLKTFTHIKRLFYKNFLLITVHMKVSKHLENISFLFYIML